MSRLGMAMLPPRPQIEAMDVSVWGNIAEFLFSFGLWRIILLGLTYKAEGIVLTHWLAMAHATFMIGIALNFNSVPFWMLTIILAFSAAYYSMDLFSPDRNKSKLKQVHHVLCLIAILILNATNIAGYQHAAMFILGMFAPLEIPQFFYSARQLLMYYTTTPDNFWILIGSGGLNVLFVTTFILFRVYWYLVNIIRIFCRASNPNVIQLCGFGLPAWSLGFARLLSLALIAVQFVSLLPILRSFVFGKSNNIKGMRIRNRKIA